MPSLSHPPRALVLPTLLTFLVGHATCLADGGQKPAFDTISPSPFGACCPWPGMQDAGIRWCRCGAGATAMVNWPDVQKSPGTLDWTASDREINNVADPLGLSLLPIFGYTPKWASRSPDDKEFHFYPPRDLRDFSRFVRSCVARYQHRIKVWEVWNEPNIGFFRGSAAEYAEMVKAGYVAAKQADPTCRVAMGCAGVDIDFLRRLYEFGCGPYFDVMSVHPYQWGAELNDGWMIDKLQTCRRLMDEHGDRDKEIWITEFGWSLGEGVSPQQQANLLVQGMVTALSVRQRLKVEKVFWFCVKDWGSPTFGLFDTDGKPKPAFVAYQAVAAALAETRYVGPWKSPEGVRAHLFQRAGEPLLVLWTPSAKDSVRVEVDAPAGKIAARTAANQVRDIAATNGKAVLEATHAPWFVTGMKVSADGENATVAASAGDPPAPGKHHRDVWLSVLPPAATARPSLLLGGYRELPLRVHNDGDQPARGEIVIEVRHEKERLAEGRVAFEVPPGGLETIVWPVVLPMRPELAGELAAISIRGTLGRRPSPIDLPVRLARGQAIEFLANSWVEQQYLYKAEKSGTSESVRFGNEFGYRFDLHGVKSAQLRICVGANGGNAWSLALSRDDKEYVVKRSGKSWPGWQTIPLDKYLPADLAKRPTPVFLRIEGDNCQVREVILETEAEVKPVTSKAIPVGYAHTREGEDLVIHRVRINGVYPTRIVLAAEGI